MLTAFHLLRATEGPRVILIERGPRFGRGAAYATANPDHLLNVRGANMSALPDTPSHFLDWLGASASDGERVFVTRERYGQYLQSLLREAASAAAGRLAFEHDAVVGLERADDGWSLDLAMGRKVQADSVVVAIGNLPPKAPEGVDEETLASDRWVPDPWRWIETGGAVHGDVLLIGSGLTSVDVALAIQERRPGARVVALSRRGLTPRAHAPAETRAAGDLVPAGGVSDVVCQIRAAAQQDWRAAIDALRPHVQNLWRSWDLKERRRFLRHVRPLWEVARHRLAPDVAARLTSLAEAGMFEVAGGRLLSLTPAPDGFEAAWTPRGGGAPIRRTFSLAINCAGPLSEIERSDDPLVANLLARGLVRADACNLGLDVDAKSRAIGADGRAVEGLYAVGPLTKGQFYEMTSVPDIRIQAAEVADAILTRLASASASGGLGGRSEALACELRAHLAETIAELEVEIEAKTASRRARSAWELRGRRGALEDLAEWLELRGTRGSP